MRIANALVRRGLLSRAVADAVLRDEVRTGLAFGRLVVERNLVSDQVYADVVSEETGAPRLRLSDAPVNADIAGQVGEMWSRSQDIVPLWEDSGRRVVAVAVLDPENVSALDDLGFRLGRRLEPVVASRNELERLARHVFHGEALERRAPRARGMDLEEYSIITGEEAMQEALRTSGEEDEEERLALARLVNENREASEVLRAIFELCVEKGVFSKEEITARLERERRHG